MEFKVFIVLVALVGSSYCYSDGAPDSECSSMTPRHHVDPQKSAFPYNINLSKKKIRAGDTIEITIQGKTPDDTIKGLLVEARVGETAIGTFDVSQSAQYVQLRDCGNSKGNAVTHKKIPNGVKSIKMLWKSPANLSEKVIVHATVARNGGTFWVDQKSEVISVN
ncbi:putative defense protein Hdd11-like [Chironomus tepperi]|uniref:putative defense protein Hdd11-like n=1 Tax=Chironomus tepperi TaxID=113505 RepID=UPI00391F5A81